MAHRRFLVRLVGLAIGLIAAIAYVHRPTVIPSNPSSPPPSSANHARPAYTPKPPAAASTPLVTNFSWRQIESEDYHRYIANLRSIGCPEQTVHDIVLADINKLYAARENPLKAAPKSGPDKPAGETPDQMLARLQQLRAVQQEKRWAVRELLGIDIPLDLLPSAGSRDYPAFEAAFNLLPSAKRDAVQSLQETFWQQSDALKTKYGSDQTPESMAESRRLSDSLRQELAKLLTPRELEDYDLRSSPTAKQLSAKLANHFRPSEEEFRQIFRAQRDHEESIQGLSVPAVLNIPPNLVTDPQTLAEQQVADHQASEQSRSAADNRLKVQLKTALGDARYADYQRSQDRTYDLLARLGVRYNLSGETVLQACNLQKSFEPSPGPVPDKFDPAVSQARMNEQLTALLGEQAARAYRRVNGSAVSSP